MKLSTSIKWLAFEMQCEWVRRNEASILDAEAEIMRMVANYNWPEDEYAGHNVKLIYHLLLDDKCKVLMVSKEGENYCIHFDTGTGHEIWMPEKLLLTPRPSG